MNRDEDKRIGLQDVKPNPCALTSGCVFCEKFGNGSGYIYEEHRFVEKSLEVYNEISRKNEIKLFIPPTYFCLACKDTKVTKCGIVIKKLVDKMQMVDLPCYLCNPEQHTRDYNKKKLELNS